MDNLELLINPACMSLDCIERKVLGIKTPRPLRLVCEPLHRSGTKMNWEQTLCQLLMNYSLHFPTKTANIDRRSCSGLAEEQGQPGSKVTRVHRGGRLITERQHFGSDGVGDVVSHCHCSSERINRGRGRETCSTVCPPAPEDDGTGERWRSGR